MKLMQNFKIDQQVLILEKFYKLMMIKLKKWKKHLICKLRNLIEHKVIKIEKLLNSIKNFQGSHK